MKEKIIEILKKRECIIIDSGGYMNKCLIREMYSRVANEIEQEVKKEFKDKVVIDLWKFKEIEDALRQVHNAYGMRSKESSIFRQVCKVYDWCKEMTNQKCTAFDILEEESLKA